MALEDNKKDSEQKKKILCVFGTRPEAIKMCPLVLELRRRKSFETVVCVTGQHREMLDGVLRVFGVTPDIDLDVMREGQSLSSLTAVMIERLERVIDERSPDIILVHGDTSTAFAASLAAFYKKIPIGHVEAGLRSGSIHEPFPEEFNRRAISLLSTLHFAPTESARRVLLSEGIADEKIFVTGNTVVDAMRFTLGKKNSAPFSPDGRRLIVFTAHRRENIGEPMKRMIRALCRLLEVFPDTVAFCPIHKNPRVRELVMSELCGRERIYCSEPLEVDTFHHILARSYLILTDSGGIQEEATALGKPTLVMRNVTERGEGTGLGILRLVGSDTDEIFEAASKLLRNEREYNRIAKPSAYFGDGRACQRICDAIADI